MANFNKVILMGNVTRNPEVKYANNGKAVATFGLAVNRKSKEYEETLFVDISAFGRLAEIAGEYLDKGSPTMVEGRLKLEQWEYKGQKYSKHIVVAENIQLLGSKQQEKRDTSKDNNTAEDDVPF